MAAAVSRCGGSLLLVSSSASASASHSVGSFASHVVDRILPSFRFSSSSLRFSSSNRSPSCRCGSSILSVVPSLRRENRAFCSGTPTIEVSDAAAEAGAAPPAPLDPLKEAAGALDIRVGRILNAWRHPEADSLYVEEVDVGEPEPRTICSGLVNYIPLEQLKDSAVIVLANLKPRNMRGVKSNGMLMAASDESHDNVELLVPPEDSIPGERIWFGSEEEKDNQPDAASPNQVQKKKIWENIQPQLKTTDSCVAVLGEYPMRTSRGVVTCRTLRNGRIS